MRWPWRRRAKDGRVVFIGSSPFDVVAAINAVPTPSPVVAAWIPDEPAAEPATPVQPLAPAALPAAPEPALAAAPAARPTAPEPAPAPPAPPAAPAAVATRPAHPAAPVPAPEPRLGVQLGFADGSVVTLDDDDPRAVALRAAAARLTSAN